MLGHTGTLCTVLGIHTPDIVSCADALYLWRHLAFCLYVASLPLSQVVFCAGAGAGAGAGVSACAVLVHLVYRYSACACAGACAVRV